MKSARWFALLCSLTLSPGASLQGQIPQILEPKVERLQGPPLWISAEAVADEKRVVNLDRLDSEFLHGIVEKQWRALGDEARVQQSKTGGKPTIASIPLAECRSMVVSTTHGPWMTLSAACVPANWVPGKVIDESTEVVVFKRLREAAG